MRIYLVHIYKFNVKSRRRHSFVFKNKSNGFVMVEGAWRRFKNVCMELIL